MTDHADNLIGQTLGGCLIMEIIGRGGMGVIYKARQKSLDRVVAIKILSHKLSDDVSFIERFQREARAIARVNNPHVLAVYDVGNDSGTYYMIMEYIDGGSLSEYQEEVGVLDTLEACEYIIQAARGLAAAQAEGIIHRDVKPDNLMITSRNVIKVSDFGLARETNTTHTATQTVMGTPAFMSPEQCDGKIVDGRTDIYSLGGTFYKLVTGRLPFEAETAMSMMYRHKHEALVPPADIINGFPQDVSDIIRKMMEKRREDRFQTLEEVIEAIENVLYNFEDEYGDDVNRTVVFSEGDDADDTAKTIPPRSSRHLRSGSGATRRQKHISARRHSGRAASGDSPPFTAPPPVAAPNMPSQPAVGPPAYPSQPGYNAAPPAPTSGFPAQSGTPLPAAPGALPPEITSLLTRADELAGRGDRYGAMKAYRRALDMGVPDPQLAADLQSRIVMEYEKRLELAINYFEQGRLIEASREFRICSDLMPEDEELKERVEDLENQLRLKRETELEVNECIRMEKFEEALALYDALPEHLRDPGMGQEIIHIRQVMLPVQKLVVEARELEENGLDEQALEIYQQILTIEPSHYLAKPKSQEIVKRIEKTNLLFSSARKKSGARDFKRAALDLEQILDQDPNNEKAFKMWIDALINGAEKDVESGLVADAIKTCERILQADEKNTRARELLSELRYQRDKENAMVEAATIAFNKKQYGRAKHYWDEVLKINPQHPRARIAVGAARKKLRKSRIRKSVSLFTFLLIVGLVARYYFEQNRYDKLFEKMNSKRVTAKEAVDARDDLDAIAENTFLVPFLDGHKRYNAISAIINYHEAIQNTANWQKNVAIWDNDGLLNQSRRVKSDVIEKYRPGMPQINMLLKQTYDAIKNEYAKKINTLINLTRTEYNETLKPIDSSILKREFANRLEDRKALFEAAILRNKGLLMEIGYWKDDKNDELEPGVEPIKRRHADKLPDDFQVVFDHAQRYAQARKYFMDAQAKLNNCSVASKDSAGHTILLKKVHDDLAYLSRYKTLFEEVNADTPDINIVKTAFKEIQSTNYEEHLIPLELIEKSITLTAASQKVSGTSVSPMSQNVDYERIALDMFRIFDDPRSAKSRWNAQLEELESLFPPEERDVLKLKNAINVAAPAKKPELTWRLMLYDLLYCRQRDMALVFPSAGVLSTDDNTRARQLKDIRENWPLRRNAEIRFFCIDRFEYFDLPAGMQRAHVLGTVTPLTVTYLNAKSKCESVKKVLCDSRQWSSACEAADGYQGMKGLYYTLLAARKHSVKELAGACNLVGGKPWAVGTPKSAQCVNTLGIYDMVGNMAEWVQYAQSGQLRGGFSNPRIHSAGDLRLLQASCGHEYNPNEDNADEKGNPRYVDPDYRGFRCCLPLDGTQGP